MIGNDVVDLSLSVFDTEGRFWRYSQKVCSPVELKQFGHFESNQQFLSLRSKKVKDVFEKEFKNGKKAASQMI